MYVIKIDTQGQEASGDMVWCRVCGCYLQPSAELLFVAGAAAVRAFPEYYASRIFNASEQYRA